MHRDARAYFWDIRDAAVAVNDFIAGMDDRAYRQDERTKAAVERKLEVIGEAVNQLAQLDPALAQRLTFKRQIIGMRNVLIHGYMAIDDELQNHRLALKPEHTEIVECCQVRTCFI